MPASLEGRLVVAISSRALFDFEEENRVFEAADDLALTTRILNEEPPRASAVAPQAIPEPAMLTLMGAGLIGLAVSRRRSRKPS